MGGLIDGLWLIARFVVGPTAAFYMKAELLSVLFRKIDRGSETDFKPKGKLSVSKVDIKKIAGHKFCQLRRYRRILDQANSSVER